VRIGFIYILTVVSLGIYCILISGWSSNSKFAVVGSIRSASQMISYEISLGVIFILIFLCFGSVKLNEIILTQNYSFFIFFFIPIFYIFLVAQLAEINRLPFDLPEAEAELVSGYNVEYSGVSFVFFNIGEYLHNILLSNMINIFFFGG
jgi:NADH-quinone oxidoreductase subunit H